MTPHWKSWISKRCDVEYGEVHGGGAPKPETFPIWAAVLNANARGVRVRVLSNECFYTVADGNLHPRFLTPLNQVKQFASVSFLHAKMIAVDGKIVSVSSINFSESSFSSTARLVFSLKAARNCASSTAARPGLGRRSGLGR